MDNTERLTLGKLERIKQHLQSTLESKNSYGEQKKKQKGIKNLFFKTPKKSGHKVVIFPLGQSPVAWLHTALNSPLFTGLVKDITFSSVSDKKKFKTAISRSTFCICYADHHHGEYETSPSEREQVKNYFGINNTGQKPLIVVVAGMEDSNHAMVKKIQESLSFISGRARDLIVFSKLETECVSRRHIFAFNQMETNAIANPSNNQLAPSTGRKTQPASLRGQKTTKGNQERKRKYRTIDTIFSQEKEDKMSLEQTGIKHTVGIFTRSAVGDYSWMTTLLKSEYFVHNIRSVQPCYISNSGFRHFVDAAGQCTFAILYHTKNRGRINITDVTDSLYDTELEYLKNICGRDNVMVVIDDLKDSSKSEKERILKNQPSIESWAKYLLLFSHEDKADTAHLVRMLKSVEQFRHPSDDLHKLAPHPTPSKERKYLEDSFPLDITNPPISQPPVLIHSPPPTVPPRPVSHLLDITNPPISQHPVLIHSPPPTVPPRPDISSPDLTIFSLQNDHNTDFLKRGLSSEIFGPKRVSFHQISLFKDKELRDLEIQCRSGIIYHNVRSNGPLVTHDGSFLYDNVLRRLSERLGRDNVMVVVDDLEDSSDSEKKRILKKYPGIQMWARDLLLISHLEKDKTPFLHKIVNQLHHHSEYRQQQNLNQPRPKSYHGQTRPDITIFSTRKDRNNEWLRRGLSSELFGNKVVSFHQMSEGEAEIQCKSGIIYHNVKSNGPPVTPDRRFLYENVLRHLSERLGRDNVMVVVDDLEDSSDREKMRILQMHPGLQIWAGDLLLISHMEKDKTPSLYKIINQLHHHTEYYQERNSIQPRPSSYQEVYPCSGLHIGIFAGSEKENFAWLSRLLMSEEFGNKNVAFYPLWSTQEQLRNAALQCRFAIIYHSERKGGIPVSSQGGYVYCEVLEQLSAKLGQQRVIMVIDDMRDSTDEVKSAILERQPSFGRFLIEVFLFSKMDKVYLHHPNNLPVHQKLHRMKEILTCIISSTLI